jgi:uncharacterized protein (TIGR03083 family)
MRELTADQVRRAIVERTSRLAESAAAAAPDAPVPTAPGWTITDLVEHVGQSQHWVAEIIERRIADPTELPTEMAVLPRDPREWQEWLAGSAQRVASACADDALDAPVFNPAGDGRSGTRFWMFSMLNEAVVHGFDAANARADRMTLTPTLRPRSSATTSRCSLPPRGPCNGPSLRTRSAALGRPCNGGPPTSWTTRARGSSNGGLTERPGSSKLTRRM